MTPSIIALLVSNAFPLAGVLLLGWKVFPLVFLYWLENAVVGGFTVAKLLTADPRDSVSWVAKLFLVPFFVFHFGMFTYIHGVLVMGLFGPKTGQPFHLLAMVPGVIRANDLAWPVATMVLSHGLSFYSNYLKNGEYQRAALGVLMAQPYSRIVVLHLTVLFGGWIVMLLGAPIGALVVLVVVKTAVDLRGHTAERRRFAAEPQLLADGVARVAAA
ncbi:MAG TPA: DUF6498-containing protein [Gemmatimonadales bacterium]|nr:DUF6498-containing protein [Gemmatimonadales bacterium]